MLHRRATSKLRRRSRLATQRGHGHGQDCDSPLRRIATRVVLAVVSLSLLSCGGGGTQAGDGPIVRLRLSPVDMSAVQAMLTVTAKDAMGQEKPAQMAFSKAPFELIGVNFPVGTRGTTTYQVTLSGDAACTLATGSATLNLDSDGIFELPVTMSPVPLCGGGATLTVQVANVIGGMGKVTSNPPGIDCSGSGAGCSATFGKGAQITLTAQPIAGTFAGWQGGGCSGTSGCTFLLNQDTQVQGIFTTCRGWCRENLPITVTANLNGVTGTAANNVVVVGDSGTALLFNGTSWQKLTPPSGSVNLYAAAARTGGSVVSIAGDMGVVLQLSGTNFTSITNSVTTAPLRAVAIGPGNSPTTFFVGENNNGLTLDSGATSVGSRNLSATVPLYGISQNPNNSGNDLFVVGALNGTRGFAISWNGGNTTNGQMLTPGAGISGNIYAVLCGINFHYAAGQSGMIVRRPTASNNADKWVSVATATAQSLRGLWAGAENNIYAVGDNGTVTQFDGTAWTNVNTAITSNLRAVWGSSPTNIYAVGDNGTILHYLP